MIGREIECFTNDNYTTVTNKLLIVITTNPQNYLGETQVISQYGKFHSTQNMTHSYSSLCLMCALCTLIYFFFDTEIILIKFYSLKLCMILF